jgi:hypothetical protein
MVASYSGEEHSVQNKLVSLDDGSLSKDNWNRVCALWAWLGRTETDSRLLRLLARHAPLAPISALKRAQRGDRRGAGKLRGGSAQALVGPLLGVRFDVPADADRLRDYDGPASSEVRAQLRSLSAKQRLDLAEHWVDYLRREREDAPSALRQSSFSPQDVQPVDLGTNIRTLLDQLVAMRRLLDTYVELLSNHTSGTP